MKKNRKQTQKPRNSLSHKSKCTSVNNDGGGFEGGTQYILKRCHCLHALPFFFSDYCLRRITSNRRRLTTIVQWE